MARLLYKTVLIIMSFSFVISIYRTPKRTKTIVYSKNKPSSGLKLTPLIRENKIPEARRAAEVKFSDFQDIKSYSGYLTVDEHYDSNLFFWFFLSKYNYQENPVILWLQGGPGSSSMFGLFTENGPFELLDNGTVKLREYSWNNNHSVIYIDNPVGTGFSYTDNGGYLKNDTAIGASLYEALLQFFQLFPELQKNDFFATGESHAGKYVPAVSYAIHKYNPLSKQKINLKGLAIGNGWSDPENQLLKADYLYQLGLVDRKGKLLLKRQENTTIRYIKSNEWVKATNGDDKFFDIFSNISGISNIYNYLITEDVSDNVLINYLNNKDLRNAIHVGNANFSVAGLKVYDNLKGVIMKSVTPWISDLLNYYQILFYNGQLDICVAYPLTTNFLRNLKFNGAAEYKTAKTSQWYVGGDLAGYVKKAGNLTQIMVRNAGHMVPTNQPLWALDMITRFTHGLSFY